MLKSSTFRTLAASLLLVTSGCLEGSATKFTLNATLDGGAFNAGGVIAQIETNVLQIAGGSQTEYMVLRVAIPATPGTVTLTGDTSAVSYGQVLKGSTTWSSEFGGSGSITFTTISQNEYAGTFTFTAGPNPEQGGTGTRVVTNGTFLARF